MEAPAGFPTEDAVDYAAEYSEEECDLGTAVVVDQLISETVSAFFGFGFKSRIIPQQSQRSEVEDCVSDLIYTVERDVLFDYVFALKYQVLLALLIVMQVESSEVNWYLFREVWKDQHFTKDGDHNISSQNLWVVRLLDSLSWIDWILYNRAKEPAVLRHHMSFFVRVAYEINGMLSQLMPRERRRDAQQDVLLAKLTDFYKEWSYLYVFTDIRNRDCFREIAVDDGTLLTMLQINNNFFGTVFWTNSALATYPTSPENCVEWIPKAPRQPWYTAFMRENAITKWCADDLFPHINHKMLRRVFFHMRKDHSFAKADEIKLWVLSQLREEAYEPFEPKPLRIQHLMQQGFFYNP